MNKTHPRAGSTANVLAGLASFIVPGSGQCAQGRVWAGLLFLVADMIMLVFLIAMIVELVTAGPLARLAEIGLWATLKRPLLHVALATLAYWMVPVWASVDAALWDGE